MKVEIATQPEFRGLQHEKAINAQLKKSIMRRIPGQAKNSVGGNQMLVSEVKCINGERIIFEETPYYFKITIGDRTWYWDKDTGKYDGESYLVEGQLAPCSFSQVIPFTIKAS